MFEHKHYVPILKGKEGEYNGLKELKPAVKRKITPLIEVPPIPWDFANESQAKSIDEHLEKVAEKIKGCWRPDQPIFIDLLWIPEEERMSDGKHPLVYVFDGVRDLGLTCIPVTGLTRSANYHRAVKSIVSKDGKGLSLRLESDDFETSAELGKKIVKLLGYMDVMPSKVDLLIDFKAILPDQETPILRAARSLIIDLPKINEWRTFTFAASAFPPNMSGFPPGVRKTERTEWGAWTRLIGSPKKIPRLPSFGDYSIAHPEPSEVDPRIMVMSANIRYAADDEWLIVRGRSVKKFGFTQFRVLSRALIGRPEYKGSSFSWGDNYINECAGGTVGTGNATTWRKVGNSHHMTLVVDQIASLP